MSGFTRPFARGDRLAEFLLEAGYQLAPAHCVYGGTRAVLDDTGQVILPEATAAVIVRWMVEQTADLPQREPAQKGPPHE